MCERVWTPPRHLVERSLKGVQLVISDAYRGLVESVADFLPAARYQRCMVQFTATSSATSLRPRFAR
jgi:transposase-like protein